MASKGPELFLEKTLEPWPGQGCKAASRSGGRGERERQRGPAVSPRERCLVACEGAQCRMVREREGV